MNVRSRASSLIGHQTQELSPRQVRRNQMKAAWWHASAERRQLTVLACDVAGLGALSSRLDLEDLCEMTTACHRCCMDIIERYHGYVANYAD